MLWNSNWKYKEICFKMNTHQVKAASWILLQFHYATIHSENTVHISHLNIFVAIYIYKITRGYFIFYLIHIHTFNWNIFQDKIKLICGSHAHCILLNNMTMSTKMFNNTQTSKHDCSPLSSRRTTILILIHGSSHNCLPSTVKAYKRRYVVPMSVPSPAISPAT
jgi:hypothetical protein